ncbi:MAG: LON peptidase substrate-binding domain-containing protein, partial [Vicinamibacterales bacterium]
MSDEVDQTDHTSDSGDDRPLSIPDEIPVLPLRDTVLFPDSFMPLAVAREASIRLIDKALAEDQLVGVFTQREASIEEPTQDDLYSVGTITHIHKMFKLPDGSLRLIVQGLARVSLKNIIETDPFIRAAVSSAEES